MQQIKIELITGRTIALDHIFQYRTYGGLVEGEPNEEMNNSIIEQALRYAQEKLWVRTHPYLIEPVVCQIPSNRTFLPSHPASYPALPDVVCLAHFTSSWPARDVEADLSCLDLVWLQQGFAPPMDSQVIERIKTIDWETHAFDGNL
jgi:hypothetical protein